VRLKTLKPAEDSAEGKSRMSRTLSIPNYRLHKQSGQAIVTLTDGKGGRRDMLLGEHNSPESRVEYGRVIGEWEARGRRLYDQAGGEQPALSVNELMEAFLEHAEQHYRREDGTATSEVREYKATIKAVRVLYGELPAADFSPLKLKVVRQVMIDAGLCRGVINQRMGRVVRMFKWAVGEEIVPESVWRALTTVRGLEKGRTEARETEAVKPVAVEIVQATLPYLLPPVRAMVELQLATGMRPGEGCAMRGCDLDMTGEIWLYRPQHHKTRHKGKARVVALGPKAQAVVKPFLKLDTQAYLFNPREALEQRNVERRRERKTKVQPSQQHRRKRHPRRRPGERYDAMGYAHAVAVAVRRANTAAACDPCKELNPAERCEQCRAAALPHWHPHQLRHTHATEVRRRFGLEAAQVALGHSQAQITEVYAERDLALATKVAREIG
jgi:integrase